MFRPAAVLLAVTLSVARVFALQPIPVDPIEASRGRAGTEFQVDRDGRVFWVDSFGSIRVDGSATGWHPEGGRFRVDPTGQAVYVDSFGSMCKDAARYSGRSDHGASGSSSTGTLYWIESWRSELMREDERLGYRASWQSPIRLDASENVYYVNPDTRTLWRNGDDTGVHFLGLDFLVSSGGDVFYATYAGPTTSQIWKLDPTTGTRTFIDRAHRMAFLKLDGEGRPWYVSPYGQIMCDKVPMHGLTHFGAFQLDADGHVYTRRDGNVMRDNAPTGYRVAGHFAVSEGGDVFAVTDTTWGRIAKNGVTLGFSIR